MDDKRLKVVITRVERDGKSMVEIVMKYNRFSWKLLILYKRRTYEKVTKLASLISIV